MAIDFSDPKVAIQIQKNLERIATMWEGCELEEIDTNSSDASELRVMRLACEILGWKVEFDEYNQVKINKEEPKRKDPLVWNGLDHIQKYVTLADDSRIDNGAF
jgi:hypothetical protein